jgi:predicted transcriptional regulator
MAGQTKPVAKPYMVSTQISNEAYLKLCSLAAKEDRTISYIIRRAIHKSLGLDFRNVV